MSSPHANGASTLVSGLQLPSFPMESVVGVIGDYAKAYSDIREAPIEFLFCAMVQQILSKVGPYLTMVLPDGSWDETILKVYLMAIGQSGDSKKSTSFRESNSFGCDYLRLPSDSLKRLITLNL